MHTPLQANGEVVWDCFYSRKLANLLFSYFCTMCCKYVAICWGYFHIIEINIHHVYAPVSDYSWLFHLTFNHHHHLREKKMAELTFQMLQESHFIDLQKRINIHSKKRRRHTRFNIRTDSPGQLCGVWYKLKYFQFDVTNLKNQKQ